MKGKNRFIRLSVLFVMLLVQVLPSGAQTNIAFYPLEDQFNSSSYNPAFLDSDHRFTFSFFPMGGTSIGYNNQNAIKELVTKFISGVITDSDYKEILSSLTDRSTFNQAIESSLLNLTFRSDIGTLNFRINENEYFSARIKGNASDFIIKSGIQSAIVGQEQFLPAQAMHYREYSLAYSTPLIHRRFKAGIRAKLYFGKAAFSSGLSGSVIEQDEVGYLQTNGMINISAPETKVVNSGTSSTISFFDGSNTGKYFLNNGNPGVGLDLGFKFRITPRLAVSMSAMDIGKINWKTNLNSKVFKDEIELSGLTRSVNADGETILSKLNSDPLLQEINKIDNWKDSSAFSTPIPLKIYSGLSYRLNPNVQLNFLNKYVVIKDLGYNSTSLTVNFNLNKHLAVNTGYAVIGNSFNNIPLAFLYKKDFGQIYVGTDNLAAFLIPKMSDFAGFSFGTCFYLFKRRDVYKPVVESYPFYKPRKIRKDRNGRIKNVVWEF